MKLINGILFLTLSECVEANIKEQTIKLASHRGSSSWKIIKDPDDKRKVLIGYEDLRPNYKDAILKRWGNPYDTIVRQPIASLIQYSTTIEQIFLQYRYGPASEKFIPIKRVKQYTRACAYLDAIKKISSDKRQLKALSLTIPEFYNHLRDMMEVEKRNGSTDTYTGNEQLQKDFPTSYIRLTQKIKEYATSGPACMIDKMYGNQLAAKVNDQVSEAHLLTLIEHPNQYDDVLVCMMYNMWANDNGYKTIDPATVGVWRRKMEPFIIANREGGSAFNEKYIREVKGMRPSAPLYLVEHDDNNLDLLFSDQAGYNFNKYVSIVVTDSYCDLVLGYSYRMAQSPEKWMIRHAYMSAMYYIRSLTGGWYMPFELKADRWAKKEMFPFYESIGKFVPPAHGNKHRGYIEQVFGSPHWKRSIKLAANNYSGNNMTAAKRGINMDALTAAASDRPMIGDQAELQIENFFNRLRRMPDIKRRDMNAPSKEQQWLAGWNKLTPEQQRPINDEQFLLTFGIKHEPGGRQISITNRGIEPQIGGLQYSYDLPESVLSLHYTGAKVNVYYDPFDMSRVMVTNGDDIRFIAHTAQLQPRALQDATTGSRTYLNAILNEKREQVSTVSNAADSRKGIVSGWNPEGMLQGNVLIKELKNEAERAMLEIPAREYDPLDQM